MIYLTTYIYYDILRVCTKRSGKLQCSVAPDVIMNGLHATLTKNHECAPILNATALTGKNLARKSKRGWSKRPEIRAMSVGSCR